MPFVVVIFTSVSHPCAPLPMIETDMVLKEYANVLMLNATSYRPAVTGILDPPAVAVPDGKEAAPQLLVQAASCLNFTSPDGKV